MSPSAGVPWRPLAAITVLVLGAHAVALRGTPRSLDWTHAAAIPFLVRVQDVPVAARSTASRDDLSAKGAPHMPAVARPARGAKATSAPAVHTTVPAARAPAASIPVSASWRYAVTAQWHGIPVRGDAVLAWQHDDASYEASLELDAPQRRVQRSTGELGPDGLRPLRFSDRLRSEEATHFDRGQGRIMFSSNRPDVPLLPGAQDRLSVLVQLAALAAADPGLLAAGTTTTLQVASTRDADAWQFTVEGPDRLDLPGGTRDTVKLTRAPRGPYDALLEVWLAPGQAYAPVRLRLTSPNADWLDLQWSGTDKR